MSHHALVSSQPLRWLSRAMLIEPTVVVSVKWTLKSPEPTFETLVAQTGLSHVLGASAPPSGLLLPSGEPVSKAVPASPESKAGASADAASGRTPPLSPGDASSWTLSEAAVNGAPQPTISRERREMRTSDKRVM